MNHAMNVSHYEQSAMREEDAAACATTRESARLHRALAEMYRHEAAKTNSVRQALRIAFG